MLASGFIALARIAFVRPSGVVLAFALMMAMSAPTRAETPGIHRVLVFSKTASWVHNLDSGGNSRDRGIGRRTCVRGRQHEGRGGVP